MLLLNNISRSRTTGGGGSAPNYLTFDILSSGTITWKTLPFFSPYPKTIEYSKDEGKSWTSITSSTSGESINVIAGDKVMFRGDNSAYAYSSSSYNCFGSSCTFNASGNIMSLVDSVDFDELTSTSANAFSSLFNSCTGLIDASMLELPATTLGNYCYRRMFYNCASLTTAPSLPAETLSQNCYSSMFQYCTSLTVAPSLPAETLAYICYDSMFYGCTSLTTAPTLPATTLADSCYLNMFRGCTSLTTAPVLPATTLASSCYGSMFYGCTSLTTAPALPATTMASGCYGNMFSGCTSLTAAPVLPATTLADSCYRIMFQGCTSLNYIKCLATVLTASNCLTDWVKNVASSGTFVKSAAATSWPTGTSGIPSGWTVQTASE